MAFCNRNGAGTMAVTNWTASSGTWTVAGDWSAGVPGVADTAAFDDFLGAGTLAPGTTTTLDGSGETVSGAGVAGTLVVSDPVTFLGTIADVVGIIQQTPTAYGGTYKRDPVPAVVLSGAGAAWSSSTGLVLGTGASLDVANGAALSVGTAAITLEAGSRLSLSDATVSGPVNLAGGTLSGSSTSVGGAQALGGSVQISGTGTILASSYYNYGSPYAARPPSFVLSGPVSGGVLSVGGSTPVPASSPGAGTSVSASAVGTLVLSGADTLPSGIAVFEGETLELASAGAAGGGPIAVQAGAALVVDAGAVVAQSITTVNLPITSGGSDAIVINADASLLIFESNSTTASAGDNGYLVNTTTLRFINGAGRSTVIGSNSDAAGSGVIDGGTGSVTVFGGRNQVMGGSAGNNLLVSTVGDPSVATAFGPLIGQRLMGGGSGDLLVGDSGGDQLVAGAGNETLSSSGETEGSYGFGTGALIFGAGGADVLAGGALNDTIVAGSGATTIYGGSGSNILDAGSGADVIVTGGRGDYVQGGSGASTVYAGLGSNTLVFLAGHGGGTELVNGFKVGTDRLALRGFGGGGTQAGVTSTQVVGGSTILTLADNTRITLAGVGSLGGASFG